MIPEIQKLDAAVIPDIFNPPRYPGGLADVALAEFSAGVGAISGCVHDADSFT